MKASMLVLVPKWDLVNKIARSNVDNKITFEFQINHEDMFVVNILLNVWDVFTPKNYSLFIWNSDLPCSLPFPSQIWQPSLQREVPEASRITAVQSSSWEMKNGSKVQLLSISPKKDTIKHEEKMINIVQINLSVYVAYYLCCTEVGTLRALLQKLTVSFKFS